LYQTVRFNFLSCWQTSSWAGVLGVLEFVPDPAGVGGHQVAGPGVAVQGLAAAVIELRGQPGVRRGQGGGLAGREPGLRPGQERRDVT
jgi:hypothetical protein